MPPGSYHRNPYLNIKYLTIENLKKLQHKNFLQIITNKLFCKKNFIYDFIAILKHFVALKTASYWEKNIRKQRVQPSKSSCTYSFLDCRISANSFLPWKFPPLYSFRSLVKKVFKFLLHKGKIIAITAYLKFSTF